MSLIDNFKTLSPTSVALFRNCPSVWAVRYLYGIKDDMKPAAWRGSAVEAGVTLGLMKGADDSVCLEHALHAFEANAQGVSDEITDKQRALIAPMLTQALALMRPMGMPLTIQVRIEVRLDGVRLPFVGYADFVWEDRVIDLKTTERLPSEPKADHAAQVSLYTHGTNRKPGLVYATAKKGAVYDHEIINPTEAIADLTRSAKSLCHALERCDKPEDFARFYAPAFESFYWSTETKAKAFEIYV